MCFACAHNISDRARTFCHRDKRVICFRFKEVREASVPLIKQDFSRFKSQLERYAETGSADERFHAVRLLVRLAGDGERAFLKQRLEAEKAEKVLEVLREAVAADVAVEQPADDKYELPPVPEVSIHAPLDKQVLEDLRQCLDKMDRAAAKDFASNPMAIKYGWFRIPLDPATPDRLFAALQTMVAKDSTKDYFKDSRISEYQFSFEYKLPPQFELIHVVRLCILVCPGAIKAGKMDRLYGYGWHQWLPAFQKHRKRAIDLRELAAVFRAIGLDDRTIGRDLISTSPRVMVSPLLGSDPNATWPYFAERLDLLEEALGLRPPQRQPGHYYFEQDERQNAFRILSVFLNRLRDSFRFCGTLHSAAARLNVRSRKSVSLKFQTKESDRCACEPATGRAFRSGGVVAHAAIQRCDPCVADCARKREKRVCQG